MEELQEFSELEESNFDLKAEIYKYLTHWKWLVFGCLLGLTIAYLYNRYSIPVYRTEATMMVLRETPNSIVGALPSGRSVLSLDNASLANQIETLTSKLLVENVIDDLDLNISYFIEGNVITVEAYKDSPIRIKFLTPESIVHEANLNLFITPQSKTTYTLSEESKDYSNTHKYGEPVRLGELEFIVLPKKDDFDLSNTVNIQVNPIRDVANNYISRMEIAPKGAANDILSLAITGAVPQKSQDFLNSLMKHFNMDGMEDKRQVAENTTEFIQERLQIISGELDSVEVGIATFKRENQIMNVESSASEYMAKSTMAEQEVFEIETQLMIIESIKKALNSSKPYRLLPESLGLESGISGLIGQYNTLVLERNTYLGSATANNPLVKTITEQLISLRENLLDNIERTKNSLNIQLRELNQLDQRAEGQFSTFPGLEKGIRSIERQQKIKEQLYLFLLQKREESAISFAATSPVAKVIDPAYTVNSPVAPKPWVILLGGFFIGLLIPLLIIFIKNFLDTKVHHKGDLNPLIKKDIPFLGEIPKVDVEGSQVIQLNDRSPLAESFRILRTNLAYLIQSRNTGKAEVIFVTSTIKGEGKTFVSFNMARTFASTRKKVLLIGGDIRNPKLHKFTADSIETKGLSDYLYDYNTAIDSIIEHSTEGDINVDVIFSGAIPPNPAELFMNDRMEELLTNLKGKYDYIIVDTAPTMIVTDTLLISPLADTTIYVVKAGFTEKKLLEFPKELKQQGKLKGLALVLNDVDYSKFSYGAKYGYSYGYGYGYGVDKDKKSILRNPFKKK